MRSDAVRWTMKRRDIEERECDNIETEVREMEGPYRVLSRQGDRLTGGGSLISQLI